jgi:hypothetical protein
MDRALTGARPWADKNDALGTRRYSCVDELSEGVYDRTMNDLVVLAIKMYWPLPSLAQDWKG